MLETELATAMRQRCGEAVLVAAEIKLFGFISGRVGGMGLRPSISR
ncbi:MAG: hypothetical protein WBS14_17100 [Rhodomicrobium sp.]